MQIMSATPCARFPRPAICNASDQLMLVGFSLHKMMTAALVASLMSIPREKCLARKNTPLVKEPALLLT